VWYIIDQQSVYVYFHQSLNGRRASYLIFNAGYMHICKYNDAAAFFHHFLPICTRFLLCVVHYRSAVCWRILLSLTEWQACMLSDFQCYLIFSAGYMHMCKCNNSAAYSHYFQPMCTRFLYTTVEFACGKPTDKLNLLVSYGARASHSHFSAMMWRPES